MKSELIKVQPKPVRDAFPRLYKTSSEGNLTVLFTSEKTGPVVVGSVGFRVGEHHSDWPSCYDKTEWIELPNGTQVTLTQE